MPSINKSTTSKKPPDKSATGQSPTKPCLTLHDWIDGTCSRCGAAKPLVVARTESKRTPPMSDRDIRDTLRREMLGAEERGRSAIAAFDAVSNDISNRVPDPGRVQRIHNASRNVSFARSDLMKAHNRLNDYLARRIVPEDLKRSG
jgi:hypothetical protein